MRSRQRVSASLLIVVIVTASCTLFTDLDGLDGSSTSNTNDAGDAGGGDATTSDVLSGNDTSVVGADTSTITDGAIPCTEFGATVFDGHCYFLVTPGSQLETKTACAKAGAHLVTVTSDAEHTFIRAFGGSNTDRWIGLEAATKPVGDLATRRTMFKWITGEPISVTFWTDIDPDGDGVCVALSSMLWVDRACADSNIGVCERE